jgi:hypothetical protein
MEKVEKAFVAGEDAFGEGGTLMAEEKKEKDASCDTCNQSNSCNPQEKHAHAQERLKSKLTHIKQPRNCTIPEWIQRWALG